jgi:hypothetical protein
MDRKNKAKMIAGFVLLGLTLVLVVLINALGPAGMINDKALGLAIGVVLTGAPAIYLLSTTEVHRA